MGLTRHLKARPDRDNPAPSGPARISQSTTTRAKGSNMKRLRLLGIVLMTTFVLTAVATATASAENPEILPVPTTSAPLKFTSEAGGSTSVQTKEEEKTIIKCAKVKDNGSFTSSDSGTVTIDWEGCKSGSANCNTAGDAVGIMLWNNADINLVTYKIGAELLLGTVIEPLEEVEKKQKNILILKCGIVAIELRGAFLSKITGVKSLVKTKAATLTYKRTKGEQELTTCELLKTYCEGKTFKLEQNYGAAGFELAAMETEDRVALAKEVEIHF
jgi:hypothetical protein